MHEQGAAVVHGVEWLEGHLTGCGLTADKVLRRERQRQAANQVSIGNCVTSLRLLSALDWPAFFERTSLVEAVLREDPAGVYAGQDFATRDRYRQAVEKLSRGSPTDEVEVARTTVALADRRFPSNGDGVGTARNHVGYYLIGEGRAELERLVRYRPKPRDRVLRFVLKHPRLIYFGGVAAVTVLVLAVAVAVIGPWAGGATAALAALAVLLALPPASDIAVSLVNYWVGGCLPPRVLPKMLFKEGVPADCAAFVVIPTLLVRPRATAALLEHLEVHYLANPDPNLRFALLTDFADAPQEHMPGDEENLRAALDGVRTLNDRYPTPPPRPSPRGGRAGGRGAPLLPFPPPPPLEPRPGLLDGLGTQARQTVGVQPPSPRRPRHQLYHRKRRPESGPAHPLYHHARRRHATAARRRPPAHRHVGPPSESAAL